MSFPLSTPQRFASPFENGVVFVFDLHPGMEPVQRPPTTPSQTPLPRFDRPTQSTQPYFVRTTDSRRMPTTTDLRNICRHGVLVRRDPNQPQSFTPYERDSVVTCDRCERRNLTTYLNYNKMDLCLPCADKVWTDYCECSNLPRTSNGGNTGTVYF